jgi:hypothetical protein
VRRARRDRLCIAAVAVALATSGCAEKFASADGDAMPALGGAETIPLRVELRVDPKSSASRQSTRSVDDVATAIAQHLRERELFEGVEFRRSGEPDAATDLYLTLEIRVAEERRPPANLAKVLLIVFSALVLTPVVPFYSTALVDVHAVAHAPGSEVAHGYAVRSEYELRYTGSGAEADLTRAWLDATREHAVRELVNRIASDRAGLIAIARAGASSETVPRASEAGAPQGD